MSSVCVVNMKQKKALNPTKDNQGFPKNNGEIMTEKIKKHKETIRLSTSHKIMLTKLTMIHSLPKNDLIEALIRRESVRFNLVEARD